MWFCGVLVCDFGLVNMFLVQASESVSLMQVTVTM